MGLKILLISTNQEKAPYPVAPIGLAAVASALEGYGHQPRVIDLAFSRNNSGRVRQALKRFRPELVGLSIRNLDNGDYFKPRFFLPEVRRLIRDIKECTAAPVVLGGAAVSVMPERIYEYLRPDFAIYGEGEEAAVCLANHLDRGTDPTGTPGLVHRQEGQTVVNKRRLIPDLNALEPPSVLKWVPVSPYFRYESYYPIQTKRGCSRRCTYCDYPMIEGRTYRTIDPEQVAEEIEKARSMGVRYFEIVDSTFNFPEDHALAFCEAMARRSLGVSLTAAVNPGKISRELFSLMEKAGFHGALCTAESASDPVLDRLRKDFSVEDLVRTASLAHAQGFPLNWVFLTGGPGESHETVEQTLSFVDRHLRPEEVVYITNGIRIYPGTGLHGVALQEGIVSEHDDLLEPTFYFSRALSEDRLYEQLCSLSSRHPNLILSSDMQDWVVPIVSRCLGALGVKRPYWRFAHYVNWLNHRFQKRRTLGRLAA